jgi:hypothetical protein
MVVGHGQSRNRTTEELGCALRPAPEPSTEPAKVEASVSVANQRTYRFHRVLCMRGWDRPHEIVEVSAAVGTLLLGSEWRPEGYVLWGCKDNGIRWYKVEGESYETSATTVSR